MNKHSLALVLLLLCGGLVSMAQTPQEKFNAFKQQTRQKYDDARHKAEADYAAFRKRANEEYAAAMERAWQMMNVQPAKPLPAKPAPKIPPAPAPDKVPTTVVIPVDATSVSSQMPAELPAIPAPPIPEAAPEVPTMDYTFYSTNCLMHAEAQSLRFTLTSVDEKGASEAWRKMSQMNCDGILHDCLAQRDEMHLGDWGYVRLLQNATEKILGKGSNEAVLMQMYLLTQSGYNVRLAKSEGKLMLLVPFSRNVYSYSYITLDDIDYYVITDKRGGKLSVCKVGYPREQVANIGMRELPLLKGKMQTKRTFSGNRFGTMKATVGVDKALIDFLNDYPVSDAWESYASVGFSDGVKSDLYPALRSQIEGKSNKKAVTMLLDFVQYGFSYATDDDQFGYERPLFGDESFYYPKNDCEDRAIVFSILVRDLLGLDVVLLDWPGHIATAVAFPEEVEGNYFTLEGRKYTVCDPTYQGAGVGMTMDCYEGVPAKLIKVGK